MTVPYTAAGDALQAEKPRVWSETPVQLRPLNGASFDLHPDGERVAGSTHVTLVFSSTSSGGSHRRRNDSSREVRGAERRGDRCDDVLTAGAKIGPGHLRYAEP